MTRLVVAAVAGLVLAVAAHAAVGDHDVTMPGKLYAPGELDVLVGETVTWRNSDSTSHTVTADGDGFDSGYLGSGASFSRVFGTTGAFAYHCRIHRSMRGIVRVYALILTGPPRPLPPGWAVPFRGVAPTPGGEVVLERLAGGATVMARTTAGADGSFVFTQRPAAPGAYRARSGDAVSPVLRVAVKPSVSVQVSAGRVAVTTSPRRPGSVVLLQVYDRDRFDWVTVAKSRLDETSRATVRLARTPARARVVVRGRSGWADGVSRTLVVAAG